jgi:hypothetical protein
MKSPLFECFLRLHQLNYICRRIPEEYQKLIKQEESEKKSEALTEEIKEESESDDSFLSADMSSDDNAMTGPSQILEETRILESIIDKKGRESKEEMIIKRNGRNY